MNAVRVKGNGSKQDRITKARRSELLLAVVVFVVAPGSVARAQWEETKLIASDALGGAQFGGSVSISGDVSLVGATGAEAAYVSRFDGATWTEEQKLTASDGAPVDSFGGSVSISGNVALVGASGDDDGGSGAGSAYVFRYDGVSWQEEQKLTASDAAADDRFGGSVSIHGDLAVVGASGNDDGGSFSGSAYVFRYDGATWQEEQKLNASDASGSDFFGLSVSIRGDVVCVGAFGNSDAGGVSGSAYIFRYDGAIWQEDQKLTASDAAGGDQFGRAVSVVGDVAIVGSRRDDDAGTSSGSAYVFRYNGATWQQEQKLTALDAAAGDEFGESVSISGDLAIVGAVGDADAGGSSGSGYVFRYDGANWQEEEKLTASDAAAGDEFGGSVSISNDVALVGAGLNDDAGNASGSAYVFRYTGHPIVQKLMASDPAVDVFLGESVSINGDVAIVGGVGDSDGGTASGAAYVYRYDGVVWFEEQKLTASDAVAWDFFGASVSINGDVAIAGAPPLSGGAGSAYVFRYDGASWQEEQKLTASDAAESDRFGGSVSISGDVALVGAARDDDAGADSGSAYVFRYDGASWQEEQKLTASDAATEDSFGGSVSISGNVAFVGALSDDDPADSGSAYVFRYDGVNWQEEQKVTASDAAEGDLFGSAVSISGAVAIVGARRSDGAGSQSGSAYVFRYDGASWLQYPTLIASDASSGDQFGISVSVDGDVAVVGARFANVDSSGAAYAFRYDGSTWQQQRVLTDMGINGGGMFGIAVSVSGNVAIAGASQNDEAANNAGAAYVYPLVVAECLTSEECDDGEVCTQDSCDPQHVDADPAGCVHDNQARPYGDVTPFGSIVPPCPADPQGELGDGFANMLDVFCAFNAFNEGNPYTQCPCADVSPCAGDGFVNMLDVFALFNAFNDDPACSAPCP